MQLVIYEANLLRGHTALQVAIMPLTYIYSQTLPFQKLFVTFL
jgi:hypothetical protein